MQWVSKGSRINYHDSNLDGIKEISQEVPILKIADTEGGGGAMPGTNCMTFEFHDISLPLPTPGRTFQPVRWKNSVT